MDLHQAARLPPHGVPGRHPAHRQPRRLMPGPAPATPSPCTMTAQAPSGPPSRALVRASQDPGPRLICIPPLGLPPALPWHGVHASCPCTRLLPQPTLSVARSLGAPKQTPRSPSFPILSLHPFREPPPPPRSQSIACFPSLFSKIILFPSYGSSAIHPFLARFSAPPFQRCFALPGVLPHHLLASLCAGDVRTGMPSPSPTRTSILSAPAPPLAARALSVLNNPSRCSFCPSSVSLAPSSRFIPNATPPSLFCLLTGPNPPSPLVSCLSAQPPSILFSKLCRALPPSHARLHNSPS